MWGWIPGRLDEAPGSVSPRIRMPTGPDRGKADRPKEAHAPNWRQRCSRRCRRPADRLRQGRCRDVSRHSGERAATRRSRTFVAVCLRSVSATPGHWLNQSSLTAERKSLGKIVQDRPQFPDRAPSGARPSQNACALHSLVFPALLAERRTRRCPAVSCHLVEPSWNASACLHSTPYRNCNAFSLPGLSTLTASGHAESGSCRSGECTSAFLTEAIRLRSVRTGRRSRGSPADRVLAALPLVFGARPQRSTHEAAPRTILWGRLRRRRA